MGWNEEVCISLSFMGFFQCERATIELESKFLYIIMFQNLYHSIFEQTSLESFDINFYSSSKSIKHRLNFLFRI